ncbi:MAG TPA: hypothetical protein VFD99_10140 [Arthrobacter sp.]|nr:hypothetical protein [Arthrobacter sp.]
MKLQVMGLTCAVFGVPRSGGRRGGRVGGGENLAQLLEGKVICRDRAGAYAQGAALEGGG